MKVYTLLKQLKDPNKPITIYGNYGNLLFKGVLKDVPWRAAKCETKDVWESQGNVTWVKVKT